MRRQWPIYIQSPLPCVRNKAINNVNSSSDVCIFANPQFYVSGATTIPTTYPYLNSGSTGVYLFSSTASVINFDFIFTGNMNSFDVISSGDTAFKYSIYKLDDTIDEFNAPSIYDSPEFVYSAVSATSSITISVSSTTLNLDGEYIFKGNFVHNACTDILRRLGVRDDTANYLSGSIYSLYDPDFDYYFIGITSAMTPIFNNAVNPQNMGDLAGYTLFPIADGQTSLTYNIVFNGDPIVTLNGLVLSKNYDYVLTASTIVFASSLVLSDVITMIGSVGASDTTIKNDLIIINNPISEGPTGGQGSNSVYFNSTTGKFEVYTSINPTTSNLIITLNGVVLAPNIDYYQSTSYIRRFILDGNLVVGDVINIYYLPYTNVVGDIYTNLVSIRWEVPIVPQKVNGFFTLELSTGSTFSNLLTSATTLYQIGVGVYQASVSLTGSAGTILYYRVKNNKNYETLTGDIIATEAYSETIPITIATNTLLSY